MKYDNRPGQQAKYSKHIVSNTDDKNVRDQHEKAGTKETDLHNNPLGTVYVMKFPGGEVHCEFVCADSYQAIVAECQRLKDEAELDTDVIALKEEVKALKNALRGTLYMFEGRAITKADHEQIAFGYKTLRDAK